jgi:putative lipoprotein
MRGILLVFTIATGPGEHPRGDRWFGPDKLQHFFTSAFVQSMAYGGLRRAGAERGPAIAGASAVTAAAGIGKELYDARMKGEFSGRDLVWDAAGAGSASVLLVRTVR